MAEVVRVSSLAEIQHALNTRNITTVQQYGEVRFELDEQTPPQQAFMISLITKPGRFGFVINNAEMIRCKALAKGGLEMAFNAMLASTVRYIDEEVIRVEGGITAMKTFLPYTDAQIDQLLAGPLVIAPPVAERNQGTIQCIYPEPIFPKNTSYERSGTRVPYQAPFEEQQELEAAAARDRRAQRVAWRVKMRLMEMKHFTLSKMKMDLMQKLWEEFRKIMDEPSDLGVGYADYNQPPLV